MGRRSERFRSKSLDAAVRGDLQFAEERRLATESQLSEMSRLLGTDEQLSGELGGDSRLAPFLRRIKAEDQTLAGLGGNAWGPDGLTGRGIDQGIVSLLRPDGAATGIDLDAGGFNPFALAGANYQGAKNPTSLFKGIAGYGHDVESYVNTQMDQIEQMARDAIAAGDDEALAEATSLLSQAEDFIRQADPTKNAPESSLWHDAFNWVGDSAFEARQQLSSPQAMIMGDLVRDAREFVDRESETSQEFRRNLTAEGERALSRREKELQRQTRDLTGNAGQRVIPMPKSRYETAPSSPSPQSAPISTPKRTSSSSNTRETLRPTPRSSHRPGSRMSPGCGIAL